MMDSLDQLLCSSVAEIVESLLFCEATPDADPDLMLPSLCATIELKQPMQGWLVVAAPNAVADTFCSYADFEHENARPLLLCELANQLAGDLQRKLSEPGAAVAIGLPRSGTLDQHAPSPRCIRTFDTGEGRFLVAIASDEPTLAA